MLRDNHRVTRIIPGPVVTVETDKTSFRAKRIIVTAGAWTNKLLQHTGLTLPLKVFNNILLLLCVQLLHCRFTKLKCCTGKLTTQKHRLSLLLTFLYFSPRPCHPVLDLSTVPQHWSILECSRFNQGLHEPLDPSFFSGVSVLWCEQRGGPRSERH